MNNTGAKTYITLPLKPPLEKEVALKAALKRGTTKFFVAFFTAGIGLTNGIHRILNHS